MKEQTDFENWLERRIKESPQPARPSLRWGLSFAMLALLVAGGVTLERRHATPAPISDEQLFSDLSQMDQSSEPKAIQPMHGLFQE